MKKQGFTVFEISIIITVLIVIAIILFFVLTSTGNHTVTPWYYPC